jgi:hypothetical protein
MKKLSIILFAVLLFLWLTVSAVAQEPRYDFDELLNCERELVYQDNVVIVTEQQIKEEGVLIVIVRFGDGETSRRLMRWRLYNLRQYFLTRGSSLASEKLVIAEGERVKGLGRVEYYLGGKLYERLLYPKNSYICHSCCGPDENFYPEKYDYERKQKRVKKKKKVNRKS